MDAVEIAIGALSLAIGLVGMRKSGVGSSDLAAGTPASMSKATANEGVGVPHQLPPDNGYFVGRADVISNLDALMENVGSTPIVCIIDGMPGIGKTALAVHWSHLTSDRFPDGQMYINLQGFSAAAESLPVGAALDLFLEALCPVEDQVPQSLDGKTAKYRTAATAKRLLILLDNVADDESARHLIPASPCSMTVITTRNRLTSLVSEGASRITLEPLPDDDARDFLSRRLGIRRTANESVEQIIDLCAGLPITTAAMRIELGVVGALRPILVDSLLYKSPDAPDGPTLRVERNSDENAKPKDPPAKVLARLKEHFGRADATPVTPDQVRFMTGLDSQTVENAMHVLSRAGKIKGIHVAELNYPVAITDVAE